MLKWSLLEFFILLIFGRISRYKGWDCDKNIFLQNIFGKKYIYSCDLTLQNVRAGVIQKIAEREVYYKEKYLYLANRDNGAAVYNTFEYDDQLLEST